MDPLPSEINKDVEKINLIPAVSSILEVICKTTGMGFAAVARVTESQWIACSVRDEINFGLQPGSELKIETTLCNEIQQSLELVAIDHVDKDEKYFKHHTPLMYGFQSYISVPIKRTDGTFYGTLCAIDPKPMVNNPTTIGMFLLFADLITFHLNALEELSVSESKLNEERKIAELREQFIAILGHDLRNPLSAIMNVSQLLMRMQLDERMTRLSSILKNSSFRMKELIENILDFAKGRMGEGIQINRKDNEPIEQLLKEVITELQIIKPDRIILTHINIQDPVNCDSKRIAQLFSNLLSNALGHGKADAPVRINAETSDGCFKLSVSNAGPKIPDHIKKHLFRPFSRGDAESHDHGLGLGLYISSEIAHAHGGTIEMQSTDEETCFTVQFVLR
ncbi:MAG: GAF domain-containing sensor histidine kinase [Daejeonella sp.]